MMKLSDIRLNPVNPRIIKDSKFRKLCKSIKDLPKMMEARPIIVDETGLILGGNMRYKVLQHMGYKEVQDSWVKHISDLTEDQKKEFVIKDNISFGEWDFEVLEDGWSDNPLEEWGLDTHASEAKEALLNRVHH